MSRARWSPALLALLLVGGGAASLEAEVAAVHPPGLDVTSAGAQETGPGQEGPRPGESLQVLLITLGQGDAVWERFGHNALWIRDRRTGEGAAYNWGIFSFHDEGFIPRLIRGTMMYYMAPADPMAMMDSARARDRRIWVQELELTPEQKLELLAFVQWNARPENSQYRYDYYRDNCSTRVRDALDRVLKGRLSELSGEVTTPHSFRWHTRRLLGDRPAPYLGIQFVLGLSADRPITGWDEMFLPLKLRDWVRTVDVPDGEGGMRPLLLREDAFTDSQRPEAQQEPPFALPWFLLAALLWGGGLLAAAGLAGGGGWLRRVPVVLLGGGWVVVAGISGSLLLGAWMFTDHVFWYRNMNLLQVNPFFLPLSAPFLLFLVRGSLPRWGRDLTTALLVISVVGLAMELLPGFRQHNLEVLALLFPMNLALWVTVVRLLNGKREAITAPSGDDLPR